MPTVKQMPCTAVTNGLRQRFASPNGSMLPSGRGFTVAFGPKNFGMSRPAVKSSPTAQSTPTHWLSSLSRRVIASESWAIISGLNEFFFAVLSITIFIT